MATWDLFHSERLELERAVDTAQVRAALARGDVVDDDLIRPAGTTTPWVRIGDHPELLALDEPGREPEPAAPPPAPAPPVDAVRPPEDVEPVGESSGFIQAQSAGEVADALGNIEFLAPEDDEDPEPPSYTVGPFEAAEHAVVPPPRAGTPAPYGEFDLSLRERRRPRADAEGDEVTTHPAGPVDDRAASSRELLTTDDDGLELLDDAPDDGEYDPLEEDEAVAEFTLSRSGAPKVEELDLAAMVDVAFQMVLFFMVTATTVLYKTLEVPRPNPESNPPAAAAQGRSKSLDDLKDDYILVEVDPAGVLKVDHEPIAADAAVLAERLRSERERTGRKAMLLSADFATPHRSAVLAYDAANEIGLGIAIARPPRP